MDYTNHLIESMNNVSLEEEDEGGLALEVEQTLDKDHESTFNANLCVVARFISEGRVDFQAMQQTLAALWKPGMGVYIKELEINLFLFQFYHEVDIKRVMDGCPWSFNRRALIMSRMKEGDNPRNIDLNTMDLWVQIYDLKAGFMTERIIKEVGNYIGTFVSSCPSNFVGVWRDFLRVRVTVNVTKPLKRRMKIRKAGDEWFWINFKYENVPTFCFICGLLGHSDKFCSTLFVTKEEDVVRPYGDWMRAPFRRQVKPIGAKWLRSGAEGGDRKIHGGSNPNQFREAERNQDPFFTPVNKETGNSSGSGGVTHGKDGVTDFQTKQTGGISVSKDTHGPQASFTALNSRTEVNVIETKKRRTGDNVDDPMGLNTEFMMDSEEEENNSNKVLGPNNNNIPKNVKEASAQRSARLVL